MQHLQEAETLVAGLLQNPFDAHRVSQAQQEFTSALQTLTQLNSDLNSVPGFATLLPVYGTRLNAALHLVPLAIALSQAGRAGCDILNLLITRLHDPLNPQVPGITAADLTEITSDIQLISSAFAVARSLAEQVRPADVQFDPRIRKFVDTFQKDAPMLQGWLDGVEKLLPFAPMLLGIGTQANYLIEVLDSTELRPGGGFIGNFGIMTLSGGEVVAAHITDVDLLDRPFEAAGYAIPFPSAYRWFDIARGSWSLRDSNLDADFPTAARAAELTYTHEGGTVPVQGVIAITPALIQQALAITGPIVVPEYQETVTAQNLIERIHYHQLGSAGEGSDQVASPDGHSSLRKRFTELIAEHVLARVHQLASSDASKFLPLWISGLHSKDLQIYFNSSEAEALLHTTHLDAAMQSSPGDDLFVVDTNMSANKANSLITTTLTDVVTIDSAGNAVHHATMRYAWTTPGLNYGNPLYRDYVRVYVPTSSRLQTQEGWAISEAFGHQVWAGFFTLVYGQTNTITLVWSVPHAATHDARGWHYQQTIQRQAGALWLVHVQMLLPSSARLSSTSGRLKSAGEQTVVLNQLLTENTTVGIDYSISNL